MTDKYQAIKVRSNQAKLRPLIFGLVIGLPFIIGSLLLLIWNEQNAIEYAATLTYGKKAVVQGSVAKIDPANNQALVYMVGEATTNEILEDQTFAIKANVLKLNRIVEMYQWVEEREPSSSQNRSAPRYSYDKKWLETYKNSANFINPKDHQNPPNMPYKHQEYVAQKIKLGVFNLTNCFVDQIQEFEKYYITQEDYNNLDPDLKKIFKLHNGSYFSGDPNAPEIGAIRIKYEIIKPHKISIIGMQQDANLQQYYTNNNSIAFLKPGHVSVDAMFVAAEVKSKIFIWSVRIILFFMMWFGLIKFLGIITIFGGSIPSLVILEELLWFITFFTATILSALTIAIVWFKYSIVVSATLIIIALLILYCGVLIINKYKHAASLDEINNNQVANDAIDPIFDFKGVTSEKEAINAIFKGVKKSLKDQLKINNQISDRQNTIGLGLVTAFLVFFSIMLVAIFNDANTFKERDELFFISIIIFGFQVLVLFGLTVSSIKFFKYYHRMEDQPTAKIRSCPQGVAELEGIQNNLAGQPVYSPLTKCNYTWYKYSISKLEWDFDLKTKTYVRTWVRIAAGASSAALQLSDDTGSCIINPTDAQIIGTKRLKWRGFKRYPNEGPAQKWYQRLFANVFGNYSYEEEYMLANSKLYAIGNFTTIDNINYLTGENLPDDTIFLISQITQAKVIQNYKINCLCSILLSICLWCSCSYLYFTLIKPVELETKQPSISTKLKK